VAVDVIQHDDMLMAVGCMQGRNGMDLGVTHVTVNVWLGCGWFIHPIHQPLEDIVTMLLVDIVTVMT
jgi:hypothetical protein